MAENIIGGVEYESEPHPGFEIDGKPVYYAKNVPDLLRGDLTLTGAEQARIPALQALFDDHQLKLAERGADDWNLWVKANRRQVVGARGAQWHAPCSFAPHRGQPIC